MPGTFIHLNPHNAAILQMRELWLTEVKFKVMQLVDGRTRIWVLVSLDLKRALNCRSVQRQENMGSTSLRSQGLWNWAAWGLNQGSAV